MNGKIDYNKLPFWSKFHGLRKIFCPIGLHIPVAAEYKDSGIIKEVYCQECCADMSIEDWIKFFKKAKGED